MRRIALVLSLVIAFAALVGSGQNRLDTSAQDASSAMAEHPLVGVWIVNPDITTETDVPGLAIFTGEGAMHDPSAGIAGAWEVVDDQTGLLTFATIFPDGTGYMTLRGPHVVDETGNTWTADYSWTVVAANGTVLDSGRAPPREHV